MTILETGNLINCLHPGFVMIICGLLVMLLPKGWRRPLALIGPVLASWAAFNLTAESYLNYTLSGYITLKLINYDNLSAAFLLIFCVISILNAIYGEGIQHKNECGMSMVYAGTIMGVVLAGDCISLIAFWELSALASMYVIYARHNRRTARASFRYILFHAFGGNMFLFGMLLYMSHYGNNLGNIMHSYGEPCFWLILIGVAVNAAIPPFNAWLSDAYPESTVTGTVYLASFTTKAAICVLVRCFGGMEALVWVGCFMAIFGACMAIMENDIRKLLSYHIVSQLGMMVVAVGAGGEIGIDGATAHAITNILFKGVLMMGAGAVIYATGKSKITELGGLARKMPVTAACFLISSLAIAGLPGLSGFVSKALITHALEEGGYEAAVILMLAAGVGTLLSITLKINYYVFFGPTDVDADKIVTRQIPWTMKLAMIIGTAFSVLIGIFPHVFYSMLPYATQIEPYTAGHVLEYIAIFIGGSIPFFMYLGKMKPHDEYSIDFDWIYRKPLSKFMTWLTAKVISFFTYFDGTASRDVGYLRTHFGNPYLWTRDSENVTIRKFSFENEDKRIGDTVAVIVFTFTIMVVAVAIIWSV